MALAYTNYAQHVSITPQTQPIAGREADMVANNAGGYGFVLDDWTRLHRFLILGSEQGSYYVSEQKLTAENAAAVIRCIKADGQRVVREAYDVNVNNRAPKVDQQLFVIALAIKYGDAFTKKEAERAARDMLRIGTHVLHFAAMLDSLGGWSRVKRRIIARWFEGREPHALAFQVLKYQGRDGWTMRDLLRLSHPSESTEAHRSIYRWILGKELETPAPGVLDSFIRMSMGEGDAKAKAMFGILRGLPREALPTEALADPEVWQALLPEMPIHALLRNLGNLSASGVIANGAANTASAAFKLTNRGELKRARVHPFAVLLATLVYKQGHGVRGNKVWPVVPAILTALEDAYDAAFDNVTPTGKRILIGIDVSGSMGAPCVGTPIPAETAAAAMAITLARLEPNAVVVQFDTDVRKVVPVTKRTGVASLESAIGGGTDCAAPVRWALGSGPVVRGIPTVRQEFDAFVILTDNETWAGKRHHSELLEAYRQQVNRNAKLVCCSMAANHANIVDPTDALSLGAAGLDANLPAIVAEFIGS